MNKEAIDRLFKQKLRGHQVSPPATAWEKLDAQLHHRRKPIWWWLRVAAVLLLIFVGTWMISSLLKEQSNVVSEKAHQSQISQKQELAVGKEENKNNQTTKAALPTAESNQAPNNVGSNDKVGTKSIDQDPSLLVSRAIVEVPKASNQNKTQASKSEQEEEVTDPSIATAVSHDSEAPSAMADNDNPVLAQKPTPEAKKAAIRIIYKRSVEQPKPVLAHNKTQDKQPSKIKRAWRKAKSIKTNDLSIGKLRAVKDGLLAFKNEKNNTESKSN